MKEEIKIPAMGESVTEATIGRILKESGASAQEGDEIIELETEKVNQVLYAPIAGVVSWKVKEGDNVKIGDVIGLIDSESRAKVEEKPAPAAAKKEEAKPPPAPPPPPPKEEAGGRMMTEAFVQELKQAPQLKEEALKKEPIKEEGRETRRPLSKIRQTIANRLVDSLHTAAMLTTFNEVDMSEIIRLRTKYKESFEKKHGVKLGLMSFFVKAVVEGLKKFPNFNAYLDENTLVSRHYYDIGIAVGTERGLIVPVVRDCDWRTFPEIEKQIISFALKAREGKLAIADLEGGGFTITNGGVYGSLLSTPILNPPQVGILGMHKIMKRAVVVDDAIVIRPMMYLALSYDHRVVDGKEAVSFLIHIKEVLEDPSRLIFLDVE
jgi:2-oxoglutarate dehydrogenase E2 component (dihydrolipoamide succinyltransferase)